MTRGVVVVGILLVSFLVWLWRYAPEDEIGAWLDDQGLKDLREHSCLRGLKHLREFAALEIDNLKHELEEKNYVRLKQAILALDLEIWLEDHDLKAMYSILAKEGYTTRKDLYKITLEEAKQFSNRLSSPIVQDKFLFAVKKLFESRDIPGLEESGQRSGSNGAVGTARDSQSSWISGLLWTVKLTAMVLVIGGVVVGTLCLVTMALLNRIIESVTSVIGQVVVSVIVGILAAVIGVMTGGRVRIPLPRLIPPASSTGRVRPPTDNQEFNLGLYDRIRGQYLDVLLCRVEWNHEDDAEVGGSSVATIHFVCHNLAPYKLQASDRFTCTITIASSNVQVPHVLEPSTPAGESSVRVSFTTRTAGKYYVDIRVNGNQLTGNSIARTYCPGPVDASKTLFVDQSQVLVVTSGIYYSMVVAPKDSFGNTAIVLQDHLTVEIKQNGPNGEVINPECVVEQVDSSRYDLLLKVEDNGHYVGCVKYQDQRIGPPNFTIICLSEDDSQQVERNMSKKGLTIWYEAHIQGDKSAKMRKVYCYLSPKQLQVREYYFRVIPSRLFTCKVCPSTRFVFEEQQGKFTLDDGYQQPCVLVSQQRELLGATFYKFVLKNIGGSDKFQDKQQFFFAELRKHHHRQSRSEIRVPVNRFSVLNSAMHATRGFSTSDWCRKFVVEFRGEEGLDWGGVSRELFELLCVECFDPPNGLFRRFNDSAQGLVHPNHLRPSHLKLKHYEFAGRVVGKCLFESAMGNAMLVKARFTRSFLAQIIGLRIHHKYFESDDPDLYTTKVHYLKENDIDELDLGLVFAEEEFSSDGGLPKIVPLMDHGEEIEVTDRNKVQYLNLLAQYRLSKCVKEEIEYFLKGLNDVIPDHLLSMFDENELELMMCGMDTVSCKDLKQHAVISGHSSSFHRVVSWFWTVIESFTQEEMAKLLQFVTGSSQLPPGGFKELSPKFQITYSPTYGRLPSAHTCFNQLCLPDYDSCEQFQQALTIAIHEGVEGFGLL